MPVPGDRASVRGEPDREVGVDAPDGQRVGGGRRPLEPGRGWPGALAFAAALDVIGVHAPDHVAREHLAPADRRQHVVDGGSRQARKRAAHLLVGEGLSGPLERPFEDLAAEPGILAAGGSLRGPPDGGAGLAGDYEGFPGRRRRLTVGPHDLHLVAVLQLVEKGRHAAVDLRADGRVADIRMDGIGEIDRVAAPRQRDQAALRGEAEDLVVEQFELRVFQELLRAVALGQGGPPSGAATGRRGFPRPGPSPHPCRGRAPRCRIRPPSPCPGSGSATRRVASEAR